MTRLPASWVQLQNPKRYGIASFHIEQPQPFRGDPFRDISNHSSIRPRCLSLLRWIPVRCWHSLRPHSLAIRDLGVLALPTRISVLGQSRTEQRAILSLQNSKMARPSDDIGSPTIESLTMRYARSCMDSTAPQPNALLATGPPHHLILSQRHESGFAWPKPVPCHQICPPAPVKRQVRGGKLTSPSTGIHAATLLLRP